MRFLAAALLWALSGTSVAGEVRGLWVVRTGLASPDAVDKVVDEAVAGGFNTLLVQVRGRGDAFYQSDLVPRSIIIRGGADFDPLARLLARARTRGLAVHAWVNVLLTGHFGQPLPPDHVLLRHPDWAMVPRSAARAALSASGRERLRLIASTSKRSDVEGYYLSPLAPGVPQHLEDVVRELLRRYPVAGLHLDFIRYPSAEFDFSRAALEAFRAAEGGSGDLLSLPARAPEAWARARRAAITSLADRLAHAARQERPGLLVSAAVVPSEAEAASQKGQEWASWLEHKTVDAICPMAYTPDARLFRAQIEQAHARAGSGQAVWAGVGAYRLPVDQIVRNIKAAREVGAAGIVLFSHESLDARALARLRREAFAAPAVVAGPPALLGTLRQTR